MHSAWEQKNPKPEKMLDPKRGIESHLPKRSKGVHAMSGVPNILIVKRIHSYRRQKLYDVRNH